jgi:hypothetical protein
MLKTIFNELPDHRRAQGRMYDLPNFLFFVILAIISGADSYRSVATFIEIKFKILKKRFRLHWNQPPNYSTIRNVIQGLDKAELEKVFRKYATEITTLKNSNQTNVIALDGKTLKGSFDNFKDQSAIQIFSAFLQEKDIILAHEEFDGHKTNEIPIAQKLIKDLNLKNCIFTADAMHCQKKL